MKKILFLLAALAVISHAQNKVNGKHNFGFGGFLTTGNQHEFLGASARCMLEQTYGVEAVLVIPDNGFSANLRFNGYFNDVIRFPKGKLPLIAGGGGGFAGWDGGSSMKLLGSFGAAYELKEPVDLFLLLDPTYEIALSGNAETKLFVTMKLGARYFFF